MYVRAAAGDIQWSHIKFYIAGICRVVIDLTQHKGIADIASLLLKKNCKNKTVSYHCDQQNEFIILERKLISGFLYLNERKHSIPLPGFPCHLNALSWKLFRCNILFSIETLKNLLVCQDMDLGWQVKQPIKEFVLIPKYNFL